MKYHFLSVCRTTQRQFQEFYKSEHEGLVP